MPRTAAARVVFFAALALGFALRLIIVFTDDGINWPDEIYQSFEPAHRLVFGHGLLPWEYVDGARTWAVPGFVAIWLSLAKLLGAGTPEVYIPLVKIVFSLASLLSAWGTYRLARAFGARELEAASAAAIWVLSAVALYFSHRALSENLAAALLPWGLALVWDEAGGRRQRIIGASLLGLATLVRLHVAPLCLIALGVLLVRALRESPRRWEPLRTTSATLAVWALVYGLWDAAAWHDAPDARFGGLFHSAVVYVKFNIIEGKSAGWGTSPWSYYFDHLWQTMPAVTALGGLALALTVRRALPVVLVVLAFFAMHIAVGHKELRFIVPALPLLCALIGVALSLAPEKPARLLVAAAFLLMAPSTWSHRELTMGQVGSYPERPEHSAWNDFGDVNRLLLAASQRSDVCGLRVDIAHLAWTGGSTYLHVPAPLYMPGTPNRPRRYNYVIAWAGSGAEVIARDGPLELVRLGDFECAPDERYPWRLP